MAKFKILAGGHIEDKGTNPRIYRAPEVVESPHDLCALFNSPGSTKFERVPDHADTLPASSAPVATLPNLDALSVKELQTLAAEEEIETHGSSKKDELIRYIRAAKKA